MILKKCGVGGREEKALLYRIMPAKKCRKVDRKGGMLSEKSQFERLHII